MRPALVALVVATASAPSAPRQRNRERRASCQALAERQPPLLPALGSRWRYHPERKFKLACLS